MSKTAKCSELGALAGTVAGAAIDHNNRDKDALIGAAVADAAAVGHGYYADKQGAGLRRQMEGAGVGVQRQGDDIKLIIPGGITFATDSTNIALNFYASLNNLANSSKQHSQNTVGIIGYTDSTGNRQRNMNLSQRRAQSVTGYLTAQGVGDTRLSTRGMGPDQPIASNSAADGRAQNRHAEVNLRPVPGARGSAQTQSQY